MPAGGAIGQNCLGGFWFAHLHSLTLLQNGKRGYSSRTASRPCSPMAQHSPTPLRRWISGSVRSEDEQPLEGVPARVIRLLSDNRVHPSGSPPGGGAAQRLSWHGIGHIMPLRGGVSSRSRPKSISKSMQPTASGSNRALKAALPSP